MTQDVITAKPSDSLLNVLKTMVDNHIGGVPIMEEDEIVGMVTKTDFLVDLDKEPYNEVAIKEIDEYDK